MKRAVIIGDHYPEREARGLNAWRLIDPETFETVGWLDTPGEGVSTGARGFIGDHFSFEVEKTP